MKNYFSTIPIHDFPLWKKLEKKRSLFSFELELTARCNNNCRHCYINVNPNCKIAKSKELSYEEIDKITDEAVSLNALWCLITGGEPLLRRDFIDIYLNLKKKGLLISVFTNANLIRDEHIELFLSYPPRDIEISVYGVTKETYEQVTRIPGSFRTFQRGLELLLQNNIEVRLKAMALNSNIHEFKEIVTFCKKRTKDYFRFDPFVHLRYDRDLKRNKEILSERLSPDKIIALEKSTPNKLIFLKKNCEKYIFPQSENYEGTNKIFGCGAGCNSFTIGFDGMLRLCATLHHESCICNARQDSIKYFWNHFIPKVRRMKSDDPLFKTHCGCCPIINLCMYCPGVGDLEIGKMDQAIDHFCNLAKHRAIMVKSLK